MNKLLAENPNWESIKNIVYSICFDEQLKHCKNCGKEMKYSQRTLSYCSYKCSASSKEIREKTKQTNLERYNCENPFQNENIKNKIKQTNLERLGCEHPLQNKEIREKIKQTCIERYNCENPTQSKEIREKIKQINLKKLGCEYPMQSKEAQKKYKQTCLEKYGCKNSFQNENIKTKIKQTNLERYEVKYPIQSEKIKQIFHDNSYDNLIPKFIEYGITPLFPKEEYTGWNKTYRWKCNKCENEFEQKIHTTGHIKECPYLPHCWNCYPRMSNVSRVELKLLDFIKQYFPNAHKDNILISPKELDIVIPELKLAIEYNGDYWHSTKCWLENHDNLDEYYNYHLNKVLETNKKGYRLIHIWENKYNNLIPKLKDILEGKENLNFTEDTIKLDRSWYNNVEIPEYELVEEIPPEMINRNGFNVENCGYLVYQKV